jgi:hypothetical protein
VLDCVVSLKDQSTFEANFCSKVEKKVHVEATTFCVGSKFQFDNPEEIFDIENCIKILTCLYIESKGSFIM